MKPPAFQFYADDFLAGVADMTQAEVGAYILLLCHQWNRGSTPVQPERQQMIAKGPVSEHVLAKFDLQADGTLRNARLELERAKQAAFRAKQQQKGILSGKARNEPRLSHGSTAVEPSGQPDTQPEGNSPSPSPSPVKVIPSVLPSARKAPAQAVVLPFESEQFRDAWSDWVKHRKEIKKPLTPQSTKQQLAEMSAWGEELAIAAMRHTIGKGWQGLVEPDGHSCDQPQRRMSFA